MLVLQIIESFLRCVRHFRAFLSHKLPDLRNWLCVNTLVIGTFLRILKIRQFCPVFLSTALGGIGEAKGAGVGAIH
ncbi:MAG: hypothetical protein QMD05_09620, partial [Candidatus Brocadiaceae bacterium]|nr:hypothetical protein [Candidatus Brocadiaceae bacterium]